MEIRRTNIDEIFYYHPNHLGSSSFVTDQNQTITQGFLYAPFGEITTEYNINFGFSVIPKYSFNAKELDEETGMYYYEARYYAPPIFTSRDPLFEKYFWMSPYAYCANNPVKYVDPSGEDGRISYTENENGASIVYESTIHVYGKGAEEAAANANAFFSTLNNTSSIEIDGKTYAIELKITWQAIDLDFNANVENMRNDELSNIPGYVQGDNFLRVGVPSGGGKFGYAGESQRGGHFGFSYGTAGGLVVHESLHNLGFGDTDFGNDIMNNRQIGREINQNHFVGMANLVRNEMSYRYDLLSTSSGFSKYVGQNPNNSKQFNFTYRNRINH